VPSNRGASFGPLALIVNLVARSMPKAGLPPL
jgi:hypothetical protein